MSIYIRILPCMSVLCHRLQLLAPRPKKDQTPANQGNSGAQASPILNRHLHAASAGHTHLLSLLGCAQNGG